MGFFNFLNNENNHQSNTQAQGYPQNVFLKNIQPQHPFNNSGYQTIPSQNVFSYQNQFTQGQLQNNNPQQNNRQLQNNNSQQNNRQLQNNNSQQNNRQLQNNNSQQNNRQLQNNNSQQNNRQLQNNNSQQNNRQLQNNNSQQNNRQLQNNNPQQNNRQLQNNNPQQNNRQLQNNNPQQNNRQLQNNNPQQLPKQQQIPAEVTFEPLSDEMLSKISALGSNSQVRPPDSLNHNVDFSSPSLPQMQSKNNLDTNFADQLADFIQSEKNASIYYKHLSTISDNDDYSAIFKNLSIEKESISNHYNEIYSKHKGALYETQTLEIEAAFAFKEGLINAILEECKSLKELSILYEETKDDENIKYLNSVLYKKTSDIGILNLMLSNR